MTPRRLLIGSALAFAFTLMAAAPAAAQEAVPKNPSVVEWTCPDHDLDTGHELKILRIEGTNKVIITTILLGDPGYFDDTNKLVRSELNVQPIAFGEYVATMRVLVSTPSGTMTSDDSAESNRFARVPGGPSKVIIK
jgi:hypothetical protein